MNDTYDIPEPPLDPPENTQRPQVENEDDQFDRWRDQQIGEEIMAQQTEKSTQPHTVHMSVHRVEPETYARLAGAFGETKNSGSRWVKLTAGNVTLVFFEEE